MSQASPSVGSIATDRSPASIASASFRFSSAVRDFLSSSFASPTIASGSLAASAGAGVASTAGGGAAAGGGGATAAAAGSAAFGVGAGVASAGGGVAAATCVGAVGFVDVLVLCTAELPIAARQTKAAP